MSRAKKITVTEATQMGVSGICAAAEKSDALHIERHGKPFAVVLSPERFQELEAIREDLLDTLLVVTRMLTDDGKTVSLDDLLEEFGESRDELMKEVDQELREAGFRR